MFSMTTIELKNHKNQRKSRRTERGKSKLKMWTAHVYRPTRLIVSIAAMALVVVRYYYFKFRYVTVVAFRGEKKILNGARLPGENGQGFMWNDLFVLSLSLRTVSITFPIYKGIGCDFSRFSFTVPKIVNWNRPKKHTVVKPMYIGILLPRFSRIPEREVSKKEAIACGAIDTWDYAYAHLYACLNTTLWNTGI